MTEENPNGLVQHSQHNVVPEKNRTIKDIIVDTCKQLLVSLIIMAVGFFALNGSAYYKILMSKWNEFRGIEINSPFQKLAETTSSSTSSVLQYDKDPIVSQNSIPSLDLEIAPPDNRIIIPRIEQNIPIVNISSDSLIRRDWKALEGEMQEALRNGVVHYPGTSLPGQNGNVVITGHSSYFPWDPGRFKDVFALLHKVIIGDRIIVYFEQDKYIYEVSEIKVVLPNDIEVLKQTPTDKLTLITCTPVGTNLKRLIVIAKPIAVNGKILENKISR